MAYKPHPPGFQTLSCQEAWNFDSWTGYGVIGLAVSFPAASKSLACPLFLCLHVVVGAQRAPKNSLVRFRPPARP